MHRDSKKGTKMQNKKHSRPEIISPSEIKQHKVKGTFDGVTEKE